MHTKAGMLKNLENNEYNEIVRGLTKKRLHVKTKEKMSSEKALNVFSMADLSKFQYTECHKKSVTILFCRYLFFS